MVVIADRQEHGRGRRGREWINAPAAVAVSVACEPRWAPERWGLLPLLAGWCAAAALGDRVGLKWPNDLLVGDDKVGGVLVEARGSVVVAGCGLNLWWPEPPPGVAGLDGAPAGSARKEEVAHAWARGFLESALDPEGRAFSLDEYRRRCVTLGRRVSWGEGGAGRAVDVDSHGALVVEGVDGLARLRSDEVFHVRTLDRGANRSPRPGERGERR